MPARTVFFLVLAVMIFVQLFITFRGLSSATAMDQAQIAREIARGNGFHTQVVRPYAWRQYLSSGHDVGALSQQDTKQPPLHPLMLAPVFHLLKNYWEFSGEKHVYVLDRAVACVSVVFLLGALLVTWLTVRKLFDGNIAGWVMIVLLFCQPLWDAARSGLPLMQVLFFFALALHLYINGLERAVNEEGGTGIALGIGLLGAVMVMTHWMAAWLVLGLATAAALFLRPRVLAPLLIALPALLVAVAWGMRNHAVCGDYFGASKAALLSMLNSMGDSYLLRGFGVSPSALDMGGMMRKLSTNFTMQVTGILGHLGAVVPAALFFISVLHPFKRAGTAAFRWSLLIIWLFAAAGMGMAIMQDKEPDDVRLHLLFTPLMSAYGFAFIAVQWARLSMIRGLGWWAQQGAASCAALLSTMSMLVSLPLDLMLGLSFNSEFAHWPPYLPGAIAKLRGITEPSEVLFTDAPWATAWYADRHSVWLPMERKHFAEMKSKMDAQGETIAGLVMTPLSVRVTDRVGAFYDGEYRDWKVESMRGVVLGLGFDLAAQSDTPCKFLLPLAGRMVDGNLVAEIVFMSERRRW